MNFKAINYQIKWKRWKIKSWQAAYKWYIKGKLNNKAWWNRQIGHKILLLLERDCLNSNIKFFAFVAFRERGKGKGRERERHQVKDTTRNGWNLFLWRHLIYECFDILFIVWTHVHELSSGIVLVNDRNNWKVNFLVEQC